MLCGVNAKPKRRPVTKRLALVLSRMPALCNVQSTGNGRAIIIDTITGRVTSAPEAMQLKQAITPATNPVHRAQSGKTNEPILNARSGRRLQSGAWPNC